MTIPRYTFLLTAYKRKYLAEAIESILGQNYAEFKLIIVDDASPENLDEVITGYGDGRIRHIKHDHNTGRTNLVSHWNKCLEYVDTEYVILASDDDIYHHDFLSEAVRLIDKYPECDVVHCRAKFINPNDEISAVSPPLKEHLSAEEYAYAYSRQWIISSLQNHVFKLSALQAIGGFVEFPLAWHTDDATILRLSLNGIAYTSRISYNFRNNGDNISSKKETVSSFSDKIKARGLFFNWLKETYLPKLKPGNSESAFLIRDMETYLVRKLRNLTSAQMFYAPLNVVWGSRKTIISTGIIKPIDIYRLLARRIVKDYIYLLNPGVYLSHFKRISATKHKSQI